MTSLGINRLVESINIVQTLYRRTEDNVELWEGIH